NPPKKHEREFSEIQELLAPRMNWRIEHHFRELEGSDKTIKNPGLEEYFLGRAFEIIEFRLDHRGAEIKSQAELSGYKSVCADFYFRRPFLIYMQERRAQHPFFVMWVDNAELLDRR